MSEPAVAVAPSIVSGDRSHINVGDTLYRVTDHGGFVTDPKKWQATVAPATVPEGGREVIVRPQPFNLQPNFDLVALQAFLAYCGDVKLF